MEMRFKQIFLNKLIKKKCNNFEDMKQILISLSPFKKILWCALVKF